MVIIIYKIINLELPLSSIYLQSIFIFSPSILAKILVHKICLFVCLFLNYPIFLMQDQFLFILHQLKL